MSRSHREAVLTRQLPLDLRSRTHGGARPGAGRPRKKDSDRGYIVHCARPSHRKGDPVHVTVRVRKGVPSLRTELLQGIVKAALRDQRAKLTRTGAKYFQVVHFSIQDDHVHLIVEAADKRGVWRGVVGLEVSITRRLNAVLRRKGRLWTDRYHRHDLRTPAETRNALRYVLLNVQKHHRFARDHAVADPASSAASFDGFARPPRTRAREAPADWPRVVPRTWLLGTGWRKHGLIDPADAPAATRTA